MAAFPPYYDSNATGGFVTITIAGNYVTGGTADYWPWYATERVYPVGRRSLRRKISEFGSVSPRTPPRTRPVWLKPEPLVADLPEGVSYPRWREYVRRR